MAIRYNVAIRSLLRLQNKMALCQRVRLLVRKFECESESEIANGLFNSFHLAREVEVKF